MSKKQLIVAWVTIGIIVFLFLFPPKMDEIKKGFIRARFMPLQSFRYYSESLRDESYWDDYLKIDWERLITFILPVLLVSGFLIYTLRDKKK